MIRKKQLKEITTVADVENFIYDVLEDWDEPVLGVGAAQENQFFPYISYLIWVFGKPFATVDTDKDFTPAPLVWNRPVICVTRNEKIMETVRDRFKSVMEKPEECAESIYNIPFVLADVEIFADPDYTYLHTIGLKRIAIVEKPSENYAPADVYLMLNPLAFYSIPDDFSGDYIFFPFPPVRAREFDFKVKWTNRKELCVAIDKSVLPVDACEGYVNACARLNIPFTTTPNKENLREYKFVLYPIGAEVAPIYVPMGLRNAILSNCIVITNCSAAHKISSTEVTWDFTDNCDILAILIDKYLTEREEWFNPVNRVKAIVNNLKALTIEGFLLEYANPPII